MNQLAQHRQECGLTQEKLATLIGVNPSQISHWECGLHIPCFSNLIKLTKALGCTIDDLF